MKIPSRGLSRAEITHALAEARRDDFPFRNGKLFAYTFEAGEEIDTIGKLAFTEYLTENGLDPTTFPSLKRFENDLVDMARRHLGGDAAVVGNFTSGGTESILLAVKTARDFARKTRPEIVSPSMLVPETAHAAFHKAASYLGVRLVATKVDPDTYRADVEDMAKKLDASTILVVASACSYAHGVVDPVPAIAALAKERGVLCHVDGCMGGFLLPYFRRLGEPVPDFDFKVPGVTSMSMDFHKYGLCPKGASVVLYRDEALRRHQVFVCADWTGYTMFNATLQSSKSGGPLAAAWAVLQFLGEEGYTKIAAELLAARKKLVAGVSAIPGLTMMGEPEMSLVAFTSAEVSVFQLESALRGRGFAVQAQLGYGASKANLHMTVNPGNTKVIDDFLVVLAEETAKLRAEGAGAAPSPEVVALAAMLRDTLENDQDGVAAAHVIAQADTRPGKMAETSQLLDLLGPREREKLLLAFVSRMFTPPSE